MDSDAPVRPTLELDDDGEAIGIRVLDARQPGEALVGSRLVAVELVCCDLSGCDFTDTVWDRVQRVECRASAVELGQANLRDVTFRDCRLDDRVRPAARPRPGDGAGPRPPGPRSGRVKTR